MASAETELGKIDLALYRMGERGNRGGDGVFWLTAELKAVVGEAKAHWPAPFIDGQGRRWWRDIFVLAGGYFPPHARARARWR